MFEVKKVECFLKGIETVAPGSFKSDTGAEIAYDGYTRVTVSIKDKNGKYIDLKTRVANSTEGQELIRKLSAIELMSKFYGDFEVQFTASGASRVFMVGFSVIK